jgi:hypothetical protein
MEQLSHENLGASFNSTVGLMLIEKQLPRQRDRWSEQRRHSEPTDCHLRWTAVLAGILLLLPGSLSQTRHRQHEFYRYRRINTYTYANSNSKTDPDSDPEQQRHARLERRRCDTQQFRNQYRRLQAVYLWELRLLNLHPAMLGT